MTKKLEELFFGDDDDDDNQDMSLNTPILPVTNDEPVSISKDTLDSIEKIEKALPQVRGLESSDAEMDELADLAKEAFNNLLDLGMQVDSRFSAEIFNSASSMLGHSITAKTAKVNKKLRMLDLQLKKAELDRKLQVQAQKAEQTDEKLPLGTASSVDRDELIKMILNNNQSQNKDKKDK
jgi:hypothetical protein